MKREDVTIAIENLFTPPQCKSLWHGQTYLRESINLYAKLREAGKTLVAIHKERFGRQSYTFTGSEFRFWVWERDGYRVYVNNRKGICLEVQPETTPDEALRLWHRYREDIES
jgi:hypothetical protein